VHGLWEDDDGLLWVVGQAPDPDWDPTVRSNAELLDATEKLYDRMQDMVIEAIDLETGEVVHHRRVPWATGFLHVIEPGLVGIPRQALAGYWQVDVFRVATPVVTTPRRRANIRRVRGSNPRAEDTASPE